MKNLSIILLAALTGMSCSRTVEIEIPPVNGEPSAAVLRVSTTPAGDKYIAEVDLHVADDRGQFIRILTGDNFAFEVNQNFSFRLLDIKSGATERKGDYSAMLLLDQSGSITGNDPFDSRIEASKIFINSLGGGDEVALASFSSDMREYYTVHHTFTRETGPMSETLDILSSTEGGGTPLYYSTHQLIDSVQANSANLNNKALIVFTDGNDTDGGTTPEEIIEKAVDSGVQVFTVGLGTPNLDVLANIAQETGGYFMWAQDARQLISYFGTLGNLLRGNAGYYKLKWEISGQPDYWNYGTQIFELNIKLSDTKFIKMAIPVRISQ